MAATRKMRPKINAGKVIIELRHPILSACPL